MVIGTGEDLYWETKITSPSFVSSKPSEPIITTSSESDSEINKILQLKKKKKRKKKNTTKEKS